MNAALVVMAAGMGSRYGGVKQIDRLGPDGEILMEYAIHDALRYGFDRIVLIIKPEMLADVKEVFADRVEQGSGIKFCYAFQETKGEWEGLPIPEARTKPLGTVHAVLSAREYLDRPFAVLNADDFYGAGAIRAAAEALRELHGAEDSAMVAYRLQNTVSPNGAVTRGVCTVEDGLLRGVTETYKIRLLPDGTIRDCSGDEPGPAIPPETPVSMNLWALHPEMVEEFDRRFRDFLQGLDPADNKSECLLPVMMDRLIAEGKTRCRVLETDEHWFGLTYREDRPEVVAELRKLHETGVYPPTLWNK